MKARSPFIVALLCLFFSLNSSIASAQDECLFEILATYVDGIIVATTTEEYSEEYQYYWTVDGYYAGEGSVLNYTPPANGTYTICLALQGPNCFWQDCTVFAYDWYDECDYEMVVTDWGCGYYYFEIPGLDPNVQVEWHTGEATFIAGNFISHVYSEGGGYDVQAYAWLDGCGYIDLLEYIYVELCEPCVPYFEVNDLGNAVYEFVNLSTTYDEVYYAWYVNGEYVSSEENLIYTLEVGSHEICLQLESGTCFDIYCTTIDVNTWCPTFINWTYLECNGVYLVLDAPVEAEVIWDMGDGNIITGGSILEYTYEENGVYDVCAYYNGPDCTQGAEVCTTVNPYPCYDCEAYFDWTYEYGILYTQNLSIFDDGVGTFWYINGQYVGDSFDLIYTLQPGEYEICLQLESEFCFDEYCASVVIEEDGCPTLIDWTYLECNTVYLVTDLPYSDGIQWSMGDGTVLTAGNTIQYTYDEPGSYEVCVFYQGIGCEWGQEACINVQPFPCEEDCIAYFEWEWVDGWLEAENLSEWFGDYVIFCWYIDGEFIGYDEDLIYYLEPGEYEICLQVLTDECDVWYCTTVVVEGDCSPCTFDVLITEIDDCVYQFEALYPYDAEVTWLLDDGTTLYGSVVTYTFEGSGEHFACANLISEFCPNGTAACENFEVECEECGCPTYIEAQELECGYYQFTLFEDTPPDGIYHWSFSDGSEQTTTAPFVYQDFAPGAQYACVWIESEHCEADDVLCTSLIVPECGDCFLDVFSTFVCDTLGTFIVQTNVQNPSVTWYLDGEYIGDGLDLTYVVTEPGNHDLCAVLDEEPLCNGSEYCLNWFVPDPCEAFFDLSIYDGWIAAENMSYYEGDVSLAWYLDNEYLTDAQSFEIDLAEPGEHNLCLYIFTDCCTSTYCNSFTIGDCEEIQFVLDAEIVTQTNWLGLWITDENGNTTYFEAEINLNQWSAEFSACLEPGCYSLMLWAELPLESPVFLGIVVDGQYIEFIEFEEGIINETVDLNLGGDCPEVVDPPVGSPVIYPNPADNQISVDTKMEEGWIEFRDLSGNLALQYRISSGLMSIDTSVLASGLYIVTVRNNQEVHSAKVEIMH